MKRYVQVWQTWDFVSEVSKPQAVVPQTTTVPNNSELERQKIQRLRVAQRISIQDLAAAVQLSAGDLSAYERGDGTLPGEARQRLVRHLERRGA